MDQESKKQFDELLRQEPGSLRQTDVDFLRARASYLTADQLSRFGEVLGLKEKTEPENPSKKAK